MPGMLTAYTIEVGTSGGTPDLAQDEVQVWFADLDPLDAVVQRMSKTICPEEYQRAMNFRFQHDRRRFIVAHAILRRILGFYLNIAPQQISFRRGQFGKLSLAEGLEESQLQFNMSHSGSGALYAMAKGRKVGADLELIRPLPDMRSLAKDCFSNSENAVLDALPEPDRLRGFFDGWTRKEAFLKATGYGLSLSTTAVEVSLAPGAGARELKVLDSQHTQTGWMLVSLALSPEYSAAVVIEGRHCRLRFAEWIADKAPDGLPGVEQTRG